MSVLLVVVLALVLAVAVGVGWLLLTAVEPYPAPSGPHPVGFRRTTLVDRDRASTHQGRSGPRVITLDTWYPATGPGSEGVEPYSDALLAGMLRRHQGIPAIGRPAPSHSHRGAPLAAGRWPVVVFNHGYGSFSKQNFTECQELASQGFLVLSLAHPGESLVSADADGAPVAFDATDPVRVAYMGLQKSGAAALAAGISEALAAQLAATTPAAHDAASRTLARIAAYSLFEARIQAWTADTLHVIARLGEVPGADPERVVVSGHSMGGSVALAIGRAPPPGVLGVVNLDAPWVRYEGDGGRLQRPMLCFLSTANRYQGKDLGLHGAFDALLRSDSPGAWVVEVPGTAHFNFTDLVYVRIPARFTPMLGPVPVARMVAAQNAAVLAFLRRVLGAEPLGGAPLSNRGSVGERFFPATSVPAGPPTG